MLPPLSLTVVGGGRLMGCNLRDLVSPEAIELSDLSGKRVAVDVFLNSTAHHLYDRARWKAPILQ